MVEGYVVRFERPWLVALHKRILEESMLASRCLLEPGRTVLWIRSGTSRFGQLGLSTDPMLEPAQLERARQFGIEFRDVLGRVTSAPGATSVSTARAILDGAGRSGELPQANTDIGDPSAFVCDLEACLASMPGSDLSPERARDYVLDGILRAHATWAARDPHEAAGRIQAGLLKVLEPDRVAICISPSTSIAAFVACALGLERSISHRDCPDFLEGALLKIERGGAVSVSLGHYSGQSRLG